MNEQRTAILEAVKHIVGILIERRMSSVPIMFRGMLANFSPDNLVGMLEGEITEDDWKKIEALFGEV